MSAEGSAAWSYFTHCQASWKLAGDVTEARCPECDETVLRRPRREIGDAPAGDDDLVELRLSDNPGGEW